MDGNSGYSQLSFSGDASSLVALRSSSLHDGAAIITSVRRQPFGMTPTRSAFIGYQLIVLTDAKKFQPADDASSSSNKGNSSSATENDESSSSSSSSWLSPSTTCQIA